VVWQGSAGNRCPYADQIGILTNFAWTARALPHISQSSACRFHAALYLYTAAAT
jgi:hypothetical protein